MSCDKMVTLLFSEKAAEMNGSVKATVKDSDGATRTVEYTCWASSEEAKDNYKWPDKREVYTGPSDYIKYSAPGRKGSNFSKDFN